MSWLGDLLRGGRDEIGWDDLVRRTAEAMADLRLWGPRGEHALPGALAVALSVPEAHVEVVRGFVDDARFDREVGAMLANRIDVPLDQLPPRDYTVAAGERLAIAVTAQDPQPWRLAIAGGDYDGRTLELAATGSDVVFGRATTGGGHGELAICEHAAFVSRRAGRLQRAGRRLEVVALDQGDLLFVRRASGEIVRPARTASGRVAIADGDTIELTDGRGETIRLAVRRT